MFSCLLPSWSTPYPYCPGCHCLLNLLFIFQFTAHFHIPLSFSHSEIYVWKSSNDKINCSYKLAWYLLYYTYSINPRYIICNYSKIWSTCNDWHNHRKQICFFSVLYNPPFVDHASWGHRLHTTVLMHLSEILIPLCLEKLYNYIIYCSSWDHFEQWKGAYW